MFLKRSIVFVFLVAAFSFSGSVALAAGPSRIHISHNWAGYAALGDTYTSVSASWVVPSPKKTNSTISADAAWVGIGGISESDLIQAGTQAIIRNGKTQYMAWYELLPDTQRILPLTVDAGDHVYVSVQERGADLWIITVTNLTTGKSTETSVAYHSSRSSAEWIVERPLAITKKATGYLPLSNFGTVAFENPMLSTASGAVLPLQDADPEQLIMVNSRTRLLAAPQVSAPYAVSYLTTSQSSRYLRALRRAYTLQPQATASERSTNYQEIRTDYVIHVIFDGVR